MLERINDQETLLKKFGKGNSLEKADLSFLDISGLHLKGISLRNALLSGSRVVDVVFEDCDLTHLWVQNADFSGVQCKGLTMVEAFFQQVKLIGACLDYANLQTAQFLLCDLSHASCRGADLSRAQMLGTVMHHTDFTNVNLFQACLRDADLEGAKFINTNMREADFRRTTLLSAVFKHVVTDDVLYYGKSPWSGQSVPEKDWYLEMPVFDGE